MIMIMIMNMIMYRIIFYINFKNNALIKIKLFNKKKIIC